MRPVSTHELPAHYVSATRAVLRYAIVMVVVALMVGMSFQESGKKLDFTEAPPGLHLEALIQLALVHGHLFVTAVLLPIAMIGAMFLARRVGAPELTPRTVRFLTWGYLPMAALSAALMLYKGYHVLLSVRFGDTDLAAINGRLFAAQGPVRFAVYTLAHVGLGLTLCLFLLGLWRSLGARKAETSPAGKVAAG